MPSFKAKANGTYTITLAKFGIVPMFDYFLLGCLAGALAGIGIIRLCWRLRRPLELAQYYDAAITEQGMYGALPIYGYLRQYCFVLVLAGCVVSTLSVVAAMRSIANPSLPSSDCPDHTTTPVFNLLILVLGIHMTTIAAFETVKHRHQKPFPIAPLVENVRKRLWGVAIFLLLATSVVAPFP